MAWAVQVTQGTISNYESGRSDIPLTALIAICDVLEVSPVEVIRRALRMSPAFRDSRGLPRRYGAR